jgi:hypothetical protein
MRLTLYLKPLIISAKIGLKFSAFIEKWLDTSDVNKNDVIQGAC